MKSRLDNNIKEIDRIHRVIILILMRYGKKTNKDNAVYKMAKFIFHKMMGKGTLMHIKFDVTERCNKKCSYCYSGKRGIEPSFDDVRNFFLQLRGRIFRIDIMGGEPMLRSDIYKIIQSAKNNGGIPFVTMFTNGTLINKQAAVELKKSGLDCTFVSFYSDNPYLQDRLCSSPGTFKAKVSAIKELISAGITTYSFTVINKNNFKNIKSIDKFIRTLGAKPVFFNQIPMAKKDLETQLSPEELQKAKETLHEIGSKHMGHVRNMFKFLNRSCFGGYFMVSIKVDGDITYCPFVSDVILGNAFKEDIFEIFRKRLAIQEFRNIYEPPRECLSCSFVQYCRGGCKAGNKVPLGVYNSKSFSCLGPWHDKNRADKINHIPYWF